jgi:hypothetical protein
MAKSKPDTDDVVGGLLQNLHGEIRTAYIDNLMSVLSDRSAERIEKLIKDAFEISDFKRFRAKAMVLVGAGYEVGVEAQKNNKAASLAQMLIRSMDGIKENQLSHKKKEETRLRF